LLPRLRKELDRLQSLGMIEPTDYPTDWCSPIVRSKRKTAMKFVFVSISQNLTKTLSDPSVAKKST